MAGKEYYTLGKGFFAFQPEGSNVAYDMGNSTEGRITFNVEKLVHYSSRSAVKTKDRTLVKSVDASVKAVIDDLKLINVKYFQYAAQQDFAQEAGSWGAGTEKTVAVEALEAWHDLGKMDLSDVTVSSSDAALTEGVDYELNTRLGYIMPVGTGSAKVGDNLTITGSYGTASKYKKLLAGTVPAMSGKVYFFSDPTAGRDMSFSGDCDLIPEGDLSLITDDNTSMSFSFEFKKGSENELYQMMTTEG